MTYGPQKPYGLRAECELTEDYFMVANQPVDASKDTVVAYSRTDGEVEAVVLQGGVVRQYYRDPTQAGGWAGVALPRASGVTAMVAGISGPIDLGNGQHSEPALKVFYTKTGDPGNLQVATIRPPATPGTAPDVITTAVAWSSQAVELQLSVNFDDSLLVAAMQPRLDSKTGPRLYFYTDGLTTDHAAGKPEPPTFGYLTGFPYVDLVNTFAYLGSEPAPRWSAVIAKPFALSGPGGVNEPNLMVFTPFDTFTPDKTTPAVPSVGIWSSPVKSGPNLILNAMNWAAQADRPSGCPNGSPETLAVVTATTLGGQNTPTLVIRTLVDTADGYEQRLWVVAHDPAKALHYPVPQPSAAWSWTELVLPSVPSKDTPMAFATGSRPLPDTEVVREGDLPPRGLLDVFVVTESTLHVIRQAPLGDAYADYTTPAYCPAIPLQPDVALMTSQTGQSAGNELLVVGADKHLQTLTKDPVSNVWTDTAVQLPAEELQELDSYRVQLTVTDATGYPLADSPVAVSASTPATVMSDQSDGTTNTRRVAQDAVTFTTDATGRILLAMVADAVSAPTLTAKAADGSSLSIHASAGVNTYFQGGSQLNYLDPVDADGTLTRAQTSTGTPVFPRAADKSAADDAVTTMTKAAGQATAGGLASARHSSTLARRDGTLGRSHPGRDAHGEKGALQGIIRDIDHWGHDALHAIKKGAAKVKTVTYEIDQDTKKLTFRLVGDFEGWAENTVSVVVHGFEDAGHVLHAVFNKLGAVVGEAIHWLKAEVLGTIVDSFRVAAIYETWLAGDHDSNGLFPALATQIDKGKEVANSWLIAQEKRIQDDFDAWQEAVDAGSTMKSLATNAAQSPVGGARRSPRSNPPTGDSSRHHGLWLYDFTHSKLRPDAVVTFGTTLEPALLGDLQKTVLGAVASATEDMMKAVEGFVAFLEDMIKDPGDVLNLGEKALLHAVEGIIDWLFFMAHKVVDTFLDLAAGVIGSLSDILFATPLVPLPGLAQLLKLIGISEPSLGKMLLVVLAFPAVVAHKIKNHGDGYPFAPTTTAWSRVGADTELEADLLGAAAGISFIWAVVDAESSVFAAIKEEPPRFIAILDILIPAILAVLTTPDTEGQPPFVLPSADDDHIMGYLGWSLGMGDAVIAGADLYAEHAIEDPAKEFENTMNWLEWCCGALALICSCIQTRIDNHHKGLGYAADVFDSLPLLAAPLLLDRFVVDSEGVTAGVNAAVVAGAGIASGILYERGA